NTPHAESSEQETSPRTKPPLSAKDSYPSGATYTFTITSGIATLLQSRGVEETSVSWCFFSLLGI
ncbi:TPA: hypothetical protein ACNRJ1_005108, partial [Escherichia coli]